MGCRFPMQYVMRIRLSSSDALLSHLLQVCLAGGQLIGYWLCARDVLELCCLVSSLVQVMCTQDLVNTDLFSFRWYAGKRGSGQYTHRRIERECAWFGSWCPSDMRTSTCFLGRLMCNVICCILSLHAVLGSTWERRSPSCSVLQSVTLLVDSHSCCCSCILHCLRCDS